VFARKQIINILALTYLFGVNEKYSWKTSGTKSTFKT